MKRFTITHGEDGWQVFDSDINAPVGEVYGDPYSARREAEYQEYLMCDNYEEYLSERQMAELDEWEVNEARMWD